MEYDTDDPCELNRYTFSFLETSNISAFMNAAKYSCGTYRVLTEQHTAVN